MARPDPFHEIRLVSLFSLRGANFWSTRPVTRIDLSVGAYDELSSAEAPGFTDSLLAALPGLVEHRCSIGERGGFVIRLRRGTYAPHIVEHVGLELQTMLGHEVGYGRARDGDRPGEYTVVFEHEHGEVGLRAAALALETVQRAFAGTLAGVADALAELRALAATPDLPRPSQRVLCGLTGGGNRAALRRELLRRGLSPEELIVDVSPAYLLNVGLPYARSHLAVVLDAEPRDVPPRYREPERAQRLVATLADGVRRDGVVVVPAKEWEVQELVRDAGRRVAVFAADDEVSARDTRVAHAVARVRDGRILIESGGVGRDAGALYGDASAAAQAAAALTAAVARERDPS